jgi:hypothetical protein
MPIDRGWRAIMQEPRYYRDEAARARRLSGTINHPEARAMLLKLAKDYEEIAADLERGAVKVEHPELMPQQDSLGKTG